MMYNNLQLFNVAQIQEIEDGIRLFRYPQKVIDALAVPEFDEQENFVQMYSGHQASARVCVGIEIRFFCDSDELVFEIGKLLNSNGVDKGVTLAYQSINPDVLTNIGRKNLDI